MQLVFQRGAPRRGLRQLVEPDLRHVDQERRRHVLAAEGHARVLECCQQATGAVGAVLDPHPVLAQRPLEVKSGITPEQRDRCADELASSRDHRRPRELGIDARLELRDRIFGGRQLTTRGVELPFVLGVDVDDRGAHHELGVRDEAEAIQDLLLLGTRLVESLLRFAARESLVETVLREEDLLMRVLECLDVVAIDLGKANGPFDVEQCGTGRLEAPAGDGDRAAP